MGKLEHYRKTEQQKYYNLIKLIADPYFLIHCYEEIATNKNKQQKTTKKGNKSPG